MNRFQYAIAKHAFDLARRIVAGERLTQAEHNQAETCITAALRFPVPPEKQEDHEARTYLERARARLL